MTKIKCKSIKATPALLDTYVNSFLAEEGISEIVHVVSSQASGSTSRYMTIFYREPVKRGRKPAKEVQEIKEVSNG